VDRKRCGSRPLSHNEIVTLLRVTDCRASVSAKSVRHLCIVFRGFSGPRRAAFCWSRARCWCGITRGAGCLLFGCALYPVGTILVTIFFNVPLNDALAAVDPTTADGTRQSNDYVTSWTTWNHVQTIAALTAAASLTVALCLDQNR